MLAFLAKIGIGSIATKLAEAYTARQQAKTTAEQIAADERIKTLEAKRDVQIAEGGSPINAIIRALFAAPVALYYAKIFLWDKVLGLGVTDPLSPELHHVAQIVIGFYFVAEGGTMIARVMKRK